MKYRNISMMVILMFFCFFRFTTVRSLRVDLILSYFNLSVIVFCEGGRLCGDELYVLFRCRAEKSKFTLFYGLFKLGFMLFSHYMLSSCTIHPRYLKPTFSKFYPH